LNGKEEKEEKGENSGVPSQFLYCTILAMLQVKYQQVNKVQKRNGKKKNSTVNTVRPPRKLNYHSEKEGKGKKR